MGGSPHFGIRSAVMHWTSSELSELRLTSDKLPVK